MMDPAISDFVIDSKEHCFFCLDKIPSKSTTLNESTAKLYAVSSLRHLTRFLRMDMKDVFLEKGNVPPHLMARVEMSKLKAILCTECALINETFSKLCGRLEQIEMEVMSSLELIHGKLLKAEERTKITVAMEDSDYEWTGKHSILKVLRDEATDKCSIKIRKSRPRIKVQNLTEGGIVKARRKCILNSRNRPTAKSNLLSPESCDISESESSTSHSPEVDSYLDDDDNSEPIISHWGIKAELDESTQMDLHSDNHNFDIETGWSNETTTIKQEYKLSPLTRQHNQQRRYYRQSDPRISEHRERIKPAEGKQNKYRCKLCARVFSTRTNTNRHIKTIHLKVQQFRCAVCSRAFSLKQNLERHIMMLHSRNGPRK